MAGKIQLLSDEVIGKIAAGEVVERPAAAIKELVENSLDAGASAVTVEIRDGGISYFRVTDNGSGIRSEDIRMAFERHATSKIRRTDDLFSIQTLGFRGEALASIAAVAHVTCTTRTKADPSGIKVQNNGGTIESIEEAACPEGTTFVVRDLFFNTPVRLKFLKKPVTEAGYVSDLMMRLILSRPDVSFRYVSQGKTLYHSAGDGKLSSAVFSIYGREMLRSMHEVDGHQAGLILKGFVGVGESGRGSRNHQSAGNESRIFASFHHTGQPVDRSVGITATNRLDESGDNVIMHLSILVVCQRILLQPFGHHFIGDDNSLFRFRLHNEFQYIKQLAGVSTGETQHGRCFFQFNFAFFQYGIRGDGTLQKFQ